jgi:diguanylate cyclase (GGDEF)-like protein
VALAAVAGYLASMAALIAAVSSHVPHGGAAGVSLVLFTLGALVLSWWAVARSADPRTRSAWIWIAASCTVLNVSGVLFAAFPGGQLFPKPGDIARLLVVPLLLTGVLRLPTRSAGSQVGRLKLALDSGAVAVATIIFLWYFQVGPAVTAPNVDLQRILAATAYPLGDVILVFGVAVALTRGVSAGNRRPMLLLASAMVPWVAGDAYLGYRQGHADPGAGYEPGWELLAFLTAHFLFAAAAFVQCQHGAAPDRLLERDSVRRVSKLPYVAVAGGFLLMLFVAAREHILYNDTLGHEAGDRLLVAFGEMLRRAILGADVAARLGGDEFAVVLHNIGTPANAEAVVRRIIQEAATPVMVGNTVLQIRGSIGIALSGPGEVGLDELIHRADVAMYQAKAIARRTGISSFAHYEPADGDAVAGDGLAGAVPPIATTRTP